MLPRVKIEFANGLIGSVGASEDGTTGLVTTAVAVVGKLALNTMYLITSLSGLDALGVTADTSDANALLYKTVKEFYSEAPTGTKLYIWGVADTVTMPDMVDKTKTYATNLIKAANGEIKTLMIAKKDVESYVPVILDGMDEVVYTAITQAQLLGEWAAVERFAPVMTILPAMGYAGTAASVADLATRTDDRVCVLIGDTASGSTSACVGVLAGRLASIPVQRSVMRVKSGSLPYDELFIGAKAAELADPDVLHDRGFVTFRTFVGKTGYFFTDDKLATEVTSDYALIPRRRVIDKAYRIAYLTMTNELGDEIPLTDAGSIPASIVKNIQRTVERAIETGMTAEGNLGIDPDDSADTGVMAYIDSSQNIAATSRLELQLRVKPYGYNKYIDISLGFSVGA